MNSSTSGRQLILRCPVSRFPPSTNLSLSRRLTVPSRCRPYRREILLSTNQVIIRHRLIAAHAMEGSSASDSDDEYLDYTDKFPDLEMAIINDDRPTFVSEANSILKHKSLKIEGRKMTNPMLCPPAIYEMIAENNAVNCAAALFEGETGLLKNLNGVTSNGESPLHDAAGYFHYELVSLFIRHGAELGAMTNYECYFGPNLTPLEYALEKLHYNFWKHGDLLRMETSIYKLVTIFFLPDMKGAVETIRLLACLTDDVNTILYRYATEGRPFQMIPLLMFARERAIAPVDLHKISSFYGSVSLREGIKEKIKSLDRELEELLILKNDYALEMCDLKRERVGSALLLLDLFERAGDAITSYLQSYHLHNKGRKMPIEAVAEVIATFFKESGFVLKEEDNDLSKIKSLYNEAPYGLYHVSEMRGRCHKKPKEPFTYRFGCDVNSLTPPSSDSLCNVKRESRRSQMARQFEWMKITDPPSRHYLVFELPRHLPSRFYGSYASHKFVKAHFKGETNATQRCALPSQSSCLRASLALACKRWIKYV